MPAEGIRQLIAEAILNIFNQGQDVFENHMNSLVADRLREGGHRELLTDDSRHPLLNEIAFRLLREVLQDFVVARALNYGCTSPGGQSEYWPHSDRESGVARVKETFGIS